jgi:iron complex outermembrane receptor protein
MSKLSSAPARRRGGRAHRGTRCLSAILAPMFLLPGTAQLPAQDLTQFSLEDLMNIRVTSVSRKEQSHSRTGAAIYVITQEEIRRSGMTNIPDLLRLVPGVNVARITASTWAVSIRGFNERYSTRVLVLIDGRSVYSQEFGGVHWDQQTVPVEEIERIEVIRGPGGTMWGANAANGVINIITRKAADTAGGMLSAGTGSQDSAQGYARYSGSIGESLKYRVYGRYFNVENSGLGGGHAVDGWHGSQAGFRADWDLAARDSLTVLGDAFRSEGGQNITTVLSRQGFGMINFNDRTSTATHSIMSRWTHSFANGSQSTLQAFYSDAERLDQGRDDLHTADVDFQYRFRAGSRHDLVAGFGYRHTWLDYEGFYNYRYDQEMLESNLLSMFLQDEIRLAGDWSLTLGAKLEHNSFTQFEYEPGAQLVWSPDGRQALWFSAARAIRQPSWFYSNSILDAAAFPLENGGVGVVRLLGNPASQAEPLLDFGAGYRKQLTSNLTIDVAAFHTDYRRLATAEAGQPYFQAAPTPHLVFPSYWKNQASARNYGAEFFATWQVTGGWRLQPGFSYLHMKVTRDSGSTDASVEGVSGNTPKHQAQLRSTLNLTRNLEWDASAYYVGGLRPSLDGGPSSPIGAYTRVDTRLGWRVGDFTEFSLTAQNLLAPRRFEFPNVHQLTAAPVQRAVVGKVTWRF